MMKLMTISLISLLSFTSAWKDKKPDVRNLDGVMEYLQQFNFMAPLEGDSRAAQSALPLRDALKDYQRYVGITPTGEMNQETLKWMMKKRCAMPDKDTPVLKQRRKRFIHEGSKWKNPRITYRLLNYAPVLEPDRQDYLVARAFQAWSDYIPVEFERKPWYENTDIDITFLSFGHGDHENFDGAGGILAHAFYPYYGGDIHFDEDEDWTIEDTTNRGTDFFSTVVHEIGHSIGLAHSDVEDSIMWPYIHDYIRDFDLHPDDVKGIQGIYGARQNAATYAPVEINPSLTEVATPKRKPLEDFDPKNICFDGPINTAVTDGNGNTFIFRGDWFYQVDNYGVMEGYPIRIDNRTHGFSPMTGPVNGALYLAATDEVLLFKTFYYASFINGTFQRWGIINQRFPGIPPFIDDAFVWPSNNKTYFLKGEIYWRLNESGLIDPNYPKPMRGWDMPYGVDAAFVYSNQRLYLFKGTNYFRFNDFSYKIDQGYPRKINHWWFGCREFERVRARPQPNPDSKGNSSSSGSLGSSSFSAFGSAAERAERVETVGRAKRSANNEDVNPRFRRDTELSKTSLVSKVINFFRNLV